MLEDSTGLYRAQSLIGFNVHTIVEYLNTNVFIGHLLITIFLLLTMLYN